MINIFSGIDPYDRNVRFCLGAIRNANRDACDAEKMSATRVRNHLGQKDKCIVFTKDDQGQGKYYILSPPLVVSPPVVSFPPVVTRFSALENETTGRKRNSSIFRDENE